MQGRGPPLQDNVRCAWFVVQARNQAGQGEGCHGAPWGRVTAAPPGRMGLGPPLTAQKEWVRQSGELGDPCRGERCDWALGLVWPC